MSPSRERSSSIFPLGSDHDERGGESLAAQQLATDNRQFVVCSGKRYIRLRCRASSMSRESLSLDGRWRPVDGDGGVAASAVQNKLCFAFLFEFEQRT